jgi:pimeloyl-ACP methyl ester carboxylesterase
MTKILLIHGAWHGGWCWKATARALRAAGHHVLCPDLPDAPDTRLADCVAVLPAAPVVLGHSMGGIVAEALAQRHPPQLLIHLCAYLPRPGDSLARLDQLLPPPPRAWPRDDGGRLILPPKAARHMMWPDCPHDVASTALPLLRPQPLGPMRDPLPGPRRAGVERHYILCRRDRAIPPALQRRMLARVSVAHVHEQPWDHGPFLSRPLDLARLICRILQGAAPS